MRRTAVDVPTAFAGVTLAVVCAGGLFLTLGGFARPHDLKARVAAVETQVARVERLAALPGDPNAYAPGAVCAEAGPGADALKQRVEANAAAASVALTALAVTPSGDVLGQTTPVSLKFEATGKYEATLLMLNLLARSQPQVFVETVDLKPQAGGSAVLKLSGRVLCWTSARR